VTFFQAASSLRNGRQRSRSLKSSDIGDLEPAPPLPNGLPSASSLNIASVTTEEPVTLEDREAGGPIVYNETPVSDFISRG
jgi:hypothetical protein